ncbi:amidohydrolase [Pseudooceanicola sp. CBS1P-1]|uniref:Amidohydrolase family protein n=1 Tax=Pseudooceanicola albus TaxID=2692189 RepID=A0A6L7G5L2_9RHOB|nr:MULTISPECIES: amidohydrolase [Pseudooceanicola]MBT9385935.1 amidohydrolase [Pseudooceanicola endophyticus]MXN19644.1 amidohydrolase family protein [Pseudooceanicola albus]
MTQTPTLILHNARIRTMDPDQPRASAIALAENRVLAVGPDVEITALATPATEVIDARGATLLPGFNDAHVHIFVGAVGLSHLSLLGVTGLDRLTTLVRDYAKAHPDEALLCAEFTDYAILGDTPVTRHLLDQILPDRPFLMTAYDNHTAWANTAALKAAGILEGRALPLGNEIVMGSDGLATGELREHEAMTPVRVMSASGYREGLGMLTGGEPDHVTPEQRASDRATILQGLHYCAANGITSIQNMDGNLYTLELLEEIEQSEGLPVRVRVPFHCKNTTPMAEFTTRAAAWRDRFTGDRLTSDFVKMFIDGVAESGTAVMLGGYGDAPDHNGDPLFTQPALNAAVAEADRLGFQVAIHAIGDGGIRMVLDAYEAARAVNGPRDSRHRIEHIELLHPDDLPRFAALGVAASMQPLHVPGNRLMGAELYLRKIGRERWSQGFRARSLKDSGVTMIYSTDWPVVPLSPTLTIRESICRTPWAPDLPPENLTLDETLEAYTRGGAWAEFKEDRKGMLKPGYLADLVLLDADLDATAPEAVDQVAPRLTVCDGRITFRAA